MQFSEAIQKFKNNTAVDRQRASQLYSQWIEGLSLYTKKQLRRVDNDDITAFQLYVKAKYSDASEALCGSSLRAFFRFTNGRGVTKISIEEIRVPKVIEKDPVVVAQSDFLTLCDIAKNSLEKLICIRMLWFTIVRVSELCDMRIDDMDLEERSLSVTARKSRVRKLVFWDETTNLLIRQLVSNDPNRKYLFQSPRGGAINKRSIERWIEDMRNEANLKNKITPHSFRHGGIHQLLDIGTSLPDIQDLAGHRHALSIHKYTKRLQHEKKEKGSEAIRKRMSLLRLKEMAKELNLEHMLKEG